MYFVGVDQSTGYPEVLPWFYTTDEVTESSEKFTDVIFSGNRLVIENEEDFHKIQNNFHTEKSLKVTLKLKLNPDISRDKKLIENIGNFANDKSLAIELEGSILSHTYYILRKLNVRIKCLDAFEPKYKKQEFYKLVRDKIPINIESKGEKAQTIKIPSNDLLQFIKDKAIEEAYEFYFETNVDKIIEELADIYEIIRAACKIFGTPIDEVVKIANNKSEKKGGFESGVVLLNTEESSLIDIIDASGNSLLINEKEKKDRSKGLKKKKISFGIDNSIILPYVITSDKINQNDLTAPVNFQDIKSIKITYTPKGIKISFIQNQKNSEEIGQLDLFGETRLVKK
jgi:predicted house-cleaning noncanonical NTP pyrophosphatase (MazG superfamily)